MLRRRTPRPFPVGLWRGGWADGVERGALWVAEHCEAAERRVLGREKDGAAEPADAGCGRVRVLDREVGQPARVRPVSRVPLLGNGQCAAGQVAANREGRVPQPAGGLLPVVAEYRRVEGLRHVKIAGLELGP